MEYDYLIVGQGLVGTVLAHTLESNDLSFMIVDGDYPETSSKVAAGLMSAVTGKRIVKTWKADELFPFALSFYKKLEQQLGTQFLFEKRIYKPFQTIEEENDFISKSADENFNRYLDFKIDTSTYDAVIKKQRGGVDVLQGGNVWTKAFLQASRNHFLKNNRLRSEEFFYDSLSHTKEGVSYKDIKAKKVVFCEGPFALNNPYFAWLPFAVTKGEQLRITSDTIPEDKIISKGGYILPIGNKQFILGASYERTFENKVTEKGREMITKKMGEVLNAAYQIVGQRSAIRPTVKDRRPFIGQHPDYENVFIFNGMGTKGVTLSPYFASHFVDFLEKGSELNKEVNIKRYYSLYSEVKK